MGKWDAVALDSVCEASVREAVQAHGGEWATTSHVTATTSLARAIRASKAHARPVATLVDLLTMPGLPGEMKLGLEGLQAAPNPSDDEAVLAHEESIRQWQRLATGRRLRTGIEFDQVLRDTVRRRSAGTPAARALLNGRRQFARSVHTLIMSGFHPTDFVSRDDVAGLAVEAWRRGEEKIPALATPRQDLWLDLDEAAVAGSERARDVTNRLLDALDVGLGRASGRRLVVHHGFYFFTPPQWALFQRIRALPDVDQLFVVHDDGRNPAFETWRRFFDPAWRMPVPSYEHRAGSVSVYAAAFRDALAGSRVVPAMLNGLTLLDCASPAELVRAWALEDEKSLGEGSPHVRRFAADAATVERYATRLGGRADSGADLAQLPVGAFLLGMHECIVAEPGARPTVRLSASNVAEILGSGFLELPGTTRERIGKRELVGAFHQAEPYFVGCLEGDQWMLRAKQLCSAVDGPVAQHGGPLSGQSDVDRIAGVAANPLRLVPWADLRSEEVHDIADSISAIVRFAQALVEREELALGTHMKFIKRTLRHGLSNVPPDVRAELEARISGFSAGMDAVLDVEGLVDVVALVLGRSADFDAIGEDPETDGSVSELRALDEIGFGGLDRRAHIANLSDACFPAHRSVELWPFHLEDHRVDDESPVALAAELGALRAETSALSDLYLMWLALDGAKPDSGLTLSWISEIDGERRNPSPLAALLMVPEGVADAVRDRLGGVQPVPVTKPGDFAAVRRLPVPVVRGESIRSSAKAKLDRRATSSAAACPRRFALQWLLGPTSAFGPAYLQEAAYGNVQNALVLLGMETPFSSANAANAVWRHLTAGQRASSARKAGVTQGHPSADPAWIFTLKGRWDGRDPLSRAYAIARGQGQKNVDLADHEPAALPPGVDDSEVCKFCPVQSRCLDWKASSS